MPKTYTFCRQTAWLTYDNKHLDKKMVYEFFSQKHGIKEFCVCHETAKTGMLHTHVLIKFQLKIKHDDPCTYWTIEGIRPHNGMLGKKEKDYKDWRSHYKYLKDVYTKKEDPNPLVVGYSNNLVEGVWACKSRQEAIEKWVKKPQDVSGILMLWENRPIDEDNYEFPHKWYPWQEKFLENLHVFDDRHIEWYYEKNGNVGKSYMVDYLCTKYPNMVRGIGNIGGYANFANLIMNELDSGWTGRVLLIDLTRNFQDKDIYSSLEGYKNHRLTNTKYKCKTVVIPRSNKLCVFANFPPEWSKCSKDRWIVREIVNADLEARNQCLEESGLENFMTI